MIKSKPLRVLLVYYIFLGASAITLALLKIHSFRFNYGGGQTEFNPIWIPTIIGGLVSLKLTLPPRSFKLFVIVYTTLWILRFTFLYIANNIGVVEISNRVYHFDLIIYNYYKNVSRLDTHLPFVLYWFINYLFTMVVKQQQEKKDEEEKPNSNPLTDTK